MTSLPFLARECQVYAFASSTTDRQLHRSGTLPAFLNMLNPNVTTIDLASQASDLEDARSWFRSALNGGGKSNVRALRKGTAPRGLGVGEIPNVTTRLWTTPG